MSLYPRYIQRHYVEGALEPRLEKLRTFLTGRPRSLDEIVAHMGTTTKTARSYLSLLAYEVPLIAYFRYGYTTYEVQAEEGEQKSPSPQQSP